MSNFFQIPQPYLLLLPKLYQAYSLPLSEGRAGISCELSEPYLLWFPSHYTLLTSTNLHAISIQYVCQHTAAQLIHTLIRSLAQ